MNKKPDVIVVGGGITGVTAAYWLAHNRKSVLLLDQADIPNLKAPSGDHMRAFYLSHGKDAFYTELAARALPLWLDINAQSGQNILCQNGFLDLAIRTPGFETQSQAIFKDMKIRAEWLDKKTLHVERSMFNSRALKGALFHQEGGFIWAQRAVSSWLAAAQKKGARVKSRIEIKSLMREKDGRIRGVKDASGKVWEAESFLFAPGIWTPALLKDYRIPIRVTRQFQIYLKPPNNPGRYRLEHFPVFRASTAGFYGFPMHIHGYMKLVDHTPGPLGDPNEERAKMPPSSFEKRCRAFLKRYIPDIAAFKEFETSLCHQDMTRDGDFIVDRGTQAIADAA
jgi:glycine/D-amino acid oxidase-like deaminating enzyme